MNLQASIFDAAPEILRPAQATLRARGLDAAWEIYIANGQTRDEITVRDIVWRLESRGSITEPQINFLRTLADRIAGRAAEQAEALDCPAGRMLITGTVISVKQKESEYGIVHKMLIRHADGWKVYGTVPRALRLPERGDTVTLTATVEPSRDDPKFGFYSRPTGAAITPAEVTQ